MDDKHRPIDRHKESTNADAHAAEVARNRFSSEVHKPPTPQRTFERDDKGHLTKIVEKDGTYYQPSTNNLGDWDHMKHERVLSSGSISVNEKSKEVTYSNHDDWTITKQRMDGSSIVTKHMPGLWHHAGPVLEIHNPTKADGSVGDIRKFSYDEHGKINGYSVISTNKNLCSNWKTTDGINWRKVDDKGQPIKDKNPEKDAKNILEGHMYVTADGTFAFDNKRKADDEAPHWTIVAADGSRHERVTNLENKKAADSLHSLQAELVKAHFNEIKPQSVTGWMNYIGIEDVNKVLKDPNRTEAQKMSAAILKQFMSKEEITFMHYDDINRQKFQQTLAGMSPQDIAYDNIKDKM